MDWKVTPAFPPRLEIASRIAAAMCTPCADPGNDGVYIPVGRDLTCAYSIERAKREAEETATLALMVADELMRQSMEVKP